MKPCARSTCWSAPDTNGGSGVEPWASQPPLEDAGPTNTPTIGFANAQVLCQKQRQRWNSACSAKTSSFKAAQAEMVAAQQVGGQSGAASVCFWGTSLLFRLWGAGLATRSLPDFPSRARSALLGRLAQSKWKGRVC